MTSGNNCRLGRLMKTLSILLIPTLVACAPQRQSEVRNQDSATAIESLGAVIDEFPFKEKISFEFSAARDGNPYFRRQKGANKRVRITYAYICKPNDQAQSCLLDGRLSGLSVAQIKSLTESAFAKWTQYVPLHFVEVDPNIEKPDIEITKRIMSGNVMGQGSYYSINIRSDIGWSAWSFEGIMAHEIGHAIGMMHSTVPSLMSPSLGPPMNNDDIEGARSIYGSGVGGVYPLAVHNGNVGLWLELKSESIDALVLEWNALGGQVAIDDAMADIGTYVTVEAAKNGESTFTSIGIVPTNLDTQFIVKNLLANTNYRFRIGYPVKGRFIYSNELAKVIPSGSVPRPPRNIGVTHPSIDRRLILPSLMYKNLGIAWIDQKPTGSSLYFGDLNEHVLTPVELKKNSPEEIFVQVRSITRIRDTDDFRNRYQQHFILATSQSKTGTKIYVYGTKLGKTTPELIFSKDLNSSISMVTMADMGRRLELSWIEYAASNSKLKTMSLIDDTKVVSEVKTIIEGAFVNLNAEALVRCSDRPEDLTQEAYPLNVCHYLTVTEIAGNNSTLKLVYETQKGSRNYATRVVATSSNHTITSSLYPSRLYFTKMLNGIEVLQLCEFNTIGVTPLCGSIRTLAADDFFYTPLQSEYGPFAFKFSSNKVTKLMPSESSNQWTIGETLDIPPEIKANQFAVGARSLAYRTGAAESGRVNLCVKMHAWSCALQSRPPSAVSIGAPRIITPYYQDKLITPYLTAQDQLLIDVKDAE